eukprot:jgi/Bigna1/87552/estExt_fgenesh1_pg.C_210176
MPHSDHHDLAASSIELEKFLVENLVTHYKRRHLAAKFHLAAFEQYMQQSIHINTLLCFLWQEVKGRRRRREESMMMINSSSSSSSSSGGKITHPEATHRLSSKREVASGSGSHPLSMALKMSPDQLHRAMELRDQIRTLLTQQKEFKMVHDILRNQLFIDPPPPSQKTSFLRALSEPQVADFIASSSSSSSSSSKGEGIITSSDAKMPTQAATAAAAKDDTKWHTSISSTGIDMMEISRQHHEAWNKSARRILDLLTFDQIKSLFSWGVENPEAAKTMIRRTLQTLDSTT